MENLRWILIIAGVAILILLYVSGKPRKARRELQEDGDRGPFGRARQDDELDPLMGGDHAHDLDDPLVDFDTGPVPGPDRFDRPGDPARIDRTKLDVPLFAEDDDVAPSGFASLSQKIEAFSAKLTPKRRKRVEESEPVDFDDGDAEGHVSQIITLHVVAPEGRLFEGEHLLQTLEERGYHYGEMNIFHSMHEGKTVFSVAKMVEPGYFDIDDVDSFQTPGISLILQLPGPVTADVAFEVLVSEAIDMADAMGGSVLDAERSTLSPQTIQHMREGIYEYMHRQKYFGGVPS